MAGEAAFRTSSSVKERGVNVFSPCPALWFEEGIQDRYFAGEEIADFPFRRAQAVILERQERASHSFALEYSCGIPYGIFSGMPYASLVRLVRHRIPSTPQALERSLMGPSRETLQGTERVYERSARRRSRQWT